MRYEVDLSNPIRHAKKVLNNKNTYSDEMNDALDNIHQASLSGQFVHVRTGSLQASAKLNSSGGGSSWKGEIAYGGASPIPHYHGYGTRPHDYVEYAGYEQDRGGDHNFLEKFKFIDEPILEQAIVDGVFN